MQGEPLTRWASAAFRAAVCAGVLVACWTAPPLAAAGPTTASSPLGRGASDAASLQVATDLGVVRGGASGTPGVRAFLAMPYAAPPTGRNRWRPPQRRTRYGDVLDATKPGQSCPQDLSSPTVQFFRVPPTNEDCLTLSVWSPDDAHRLPVMVFLHGGGLIEGSAHQPLYAGDRLAARGVVLIDVNYRLGAFGFLALPEMAKESADGSYGNYGLADQAAALRWVQRNVTAFGGDPANVTIFGESSGATSVCAHLDSPASSGLFERAILQSTLDCRVYESADEASDAGQTLLASVGCRDVGCLRALPADRLIDAQFLPKIVADGARIPLTRQRGRRVPLLVGSNADEAKVFSLTTPEPTDDELVRLAAEFSGRPQDLVALYPTFSNNLERYRALWTDARYVCPTVAIARNASGASYVYHFTYTSPGTLFGLGPVHGAELPFVFDHPEAIVGGRARFEGTDAEVSATIQSTWVRFARTGRPGPTGSWEPYRTASRVTELDAIPRLTTEFRDGRCPEVNRLTSVKG